jgi:hypothetical protein
VVLARRLVPYRASSLDYHAPMAYLSVCHGGRTAQVLAPDAQVLPALTPHCQPGYDSVQCGPTPSLSTCFVNRSCSHNEYSAAHDRVCSAKTPRDAAFWDELALVFREHSHSSLPRTPKNHWVLRFKNSKRVRLFDAGRNTAWSAPRPRDHVRLAFVKREHNLWLAPGVLDQIIPFPDITSDELPGWPYKAPRMISGCTPESETVFGPASLDFTRHVAATFPTTSRIAYAWCVTAESMGTWFDTFVPEHWQGGERDINKMDKEQGLESLVNFDGSIYSVVAPEVVPYLPAHAAGRGFTPHGVAYRTPAVMSSGRGDTHGANSAKSGTILLYSARTITAEGIVVPRNSRESIYATGRIAGALGGDDTQYFHPPNDIGFDEHYAACLLRAGFPSTGGPQPRHLASFYSSRFWPHTDGSLLTGLLGRHLLKAYLATGLKWRGLADLSAWAHSTCLSHTVSYAHVPVASALHARMADLTSGEAAVDRRQIVFARAHAKTSQQYDHCAMMYGCSVGDLIDLENMFAHLRNPYCSYHHPVLERMFSLDVAAWQWPFRLSISLSPNSRAALTRCRSAVRAFVSHLRASGSRFCRGPRAVASWVRDSIFLTLWSTYAILVAPPIEELLKRTHPLAPAFLSVLESLQDAPSLAALPWPIWLARRLTNTFLHHLWARLPLPLGVLCHAAYNFIVLYVVPSAPGALAPRKVAHGIFAFVRFLVTMPRRARAAASSVAPPSSRKPVRPRPRLPQPRREQPVSGDTSNSRFPLNVPRRPRRARARAPARSTSNATTGLTIANGAALHNAVLFLESLASPKETVARSLPDASLPSRCVTAKARVTIPWNQVIGDDSKYDPYWYAGIRVIPNLQEGYYLLEGVVDTADVGSNPDQWDWDLGHDFTFTTDYTANYQFYRVTGLSMTIHRAGPAVDAGSTTWHYLYPSNDNFPVGSLLSDVTNFPRVKVRSSTEAADFANPVESVWLPLTTGTPTGSGNSTDNATGLTWREGTTSGSAIEDQSLVFLAQSTNGLPNSDETKLGTPPNELFSAEIVIHLEGAPFGADWFITPPTKVVGSMAAVQSVWNEVTLALSDSDPTDPQAFRRAVKAIGPRLGGGFLDFIKGIGRGIKRGIDSAGQIATGITAVAGGINSLFGRKLTDRQLREVRLAHSAAHLVSAPDHSPMRSRTLLDEFLDEPSDWWTVYMRHVERAQPPKVTESDTPLGGDSTPGLGPNPAARAMLSPRNAKLLRRSAALYHLTESKQ